jgi:hypothetical protein
MLTDFQLTVQQIFDSMPDDDGGVGDWTSVKEQKRFTKWLRSQLTEEEQELLYHDLKKWPSRFTTGEMISRLIESKLCAPRMH